MSIHDVLEESQLFVLAKGSVDFTAQTVFGNAAECLSFLWRVGQEDGLGLTCGGELKELSCSGVIEDLGISVGICPLVACDEAFKLLSLRDFGFGYSILCRLDG